MLEPPDLTDEAIIEALGEAFELKSPTLTFLPLGNDSTAWAFRVDMSARSSYFLKVRSTAPALPGILIPRYLRDRGVPQVIAPFKTSTDELWTQQNDFALTLYPFIEGRRAADMNLSEHHWLSLGRALRQIHSSRLPPVLTEVVGKDSFVPAKSELIARLDATVADSVSSDPITHNLAGFWRHHQDEIHMLAERADTLGRELERASLPLVLCHADLHTWNMLVDDNGHLWIVDWDESVLAPKERDLMFVIGGIAKGLVSAGGTAAVLRGYGETTIDTLALAYYRYAWAVQDIAAFGEEAIFPPESGRKTRSAALDAFKKLFDAGQIVDLATTSDGIVA